jgi:hypothetical protein
VDRPQREARRQENITAVKHGGKVTPASGSGSVKNDVRNDEWSFEVKSTSNRSYSISLDTLARLEDNALQDGRRMALVVSFVTRTGQARRYVLVDENDFIEKLEHGTQTP